MLELILVRHGETDCNIKGTYCGWTDAELNSNGRNQARRAARKLKNVKFDAVYSSPLKRALHTAQIINMGTDKEIICSDSMKEQNFGDWDNLTYNEIQERFPEECSKWKNDWTNFCMKGGESALQVYRRVAAFTDSIIDDHGNGTILLVTHLGCIRFILAHLLGMSFEGFWRFKVDNGSISRIVIADNNFAYMTAMNK